MHKTYFDMFIDGAREGWNISVRSLLPNMVMAFILIKILTDLGVLTFLGEIGAPVMGLFGVAGAGLVVLAASLLSMSGGTGVAMGLLVGGQLNGTDITIIMPAIYLLGGQIQNLGRILGLIAIPPRFYPMIWAVTLLNAAIGMWIMRFILSVI